MKKFNKKIWVPTIILCISVIAQSIISALHLTTEVHYKWYELIISITTVIPSYYLTYQIGKTITKNEKPKNKQ